MMQVIEPLHVEANGQVSESCLCGSFTEFAALVMSKTGWRETDEEASYWGCGGCGRVIGLEGVVAPEGTWIDTE